MRDIVSLKGINGDVVLKIDPNAPFSEVVDKIKSLIESERNFFSRGFLSVDTQGRELSEEEISELEGVFSGINVSFKINESEKIFGNINEKVEQTAFVVDHTVRSGQVVRYDGDIIILGNVNPDGVVESKSSVYIYGVIKGKVTAGKRVVALGFQQQYLQVNGMEIETKTPEKSRKPYIVETDGDRKVLVVPLDEREAKPVRRRKNG